MEACTNSACRLLPVYLVPQDCNFPFCQLIPVFRERHDEINTARYQRTSFVPPIPKGNPATRGGELSDNPPIDCEDFDIRVSNQPVDLKSSTVRQSERIRRYQEFIKVLYGRHRRRRQAREAVLCAKVCDPALLVK